MHVTLLKRWWMEIAGALVVLLVRIASAPKTPWENDEFLFIEAVRKFDPSRYHPHPPGFPLYVLAGKAVNAVVGDPFHALVVIGIICSAAAFVAVAQLLRDCTGDATVGAAGAIVFSFSATMLVHGPLALSDVPAVMCVAFALLAMARIDGEHAERSATEVGFWSSAAIGCRPQLLLPLLPVMLLVLWRMRTRQQRTAAISTFGFVSLLWFVPLTLAAGGFGSVLAYERKQAAYFAAHDAAMSRGARGAAEIAVRFLVHPWGAKIITIPLLILAVMGAVSLVRRWKGRWPWPLIPLTLFTLAQLVFELLTMDPTDAARYSLPATIFFALLVACGLRLIRDVTGAASAPIVGAAALAALSWWYVEPVIAQRVAQPSPPAAAAAFVNRTYPVNTVVLYDLSLRPHVEYLLPRFRSMAVEPGLRALYDRPDVPAIHFVDGGSKSPEAHVFSWPASDAYGKLTRNLYRVVTVDPLRPVERYLPVRGVYALERNIAGEEWRWIQRDATIRLPREHGVAVSLAFQLSHDAPYATDAVRLFVNGAPAAAVEVAKERRAVAQVAVPPGSAEIRIVAAEDFAPATVLHNQDPRSLAVQLLSVDEH